VTVAFPELLRVSVWGLLEPAATFPKLSVVALGTNVPAEPLPDPVLVAVEPAPVKPTQPETKSSATVATTKANMPNDERRL